MHEGSIRTAEPGVFTLKRVRVKVRPGVPRERPKLGVLPLDPRDPDIIRAKEILRSKDRR